MDFSTVRPHLRQDGDSCCAPGEWEKRGGQIYFLVTPATVLSDPMAKWARVTDGPPDPYGFHHAGKGRGKE